MPQNVNGPTPALEKILVNLRRADALLDQLDDLIDEVEPPLLIDETKRAKIAKGAAPKTLGSITTVTPLRRAFLGTETPIMELRGAIETLREQAITAVDPEAAAVLAGGEA